MNRFLSTAMIVVLVLSACNLPDSLSSEPTSTAAVASGSFGIWFVSTTGNDDNICSDPSTPCLTIYEALYQASAGDQIMLEAGTYGGLRDPDGNEGLLISKDISIIGAGQENTFLDGSDVFSPIVRTEPGVSLSLFDLTIRRGRGLNGNGIDTWGELQLQNVTIRDNRGMGISALLTGSPYSIYLYNVKILNNQNGGVIQRITGEASVGGDIEINHSIIADNEGTGIVNYGELVINHTTIDHNLAGNELLGGMGTYGGSGIVNMEGGTARIIQSTISNGRIPSDRSQASIWNWGDLTLINSTVSGNAGFGVRSTGEGGSLSLIYTTVADNQYGVYVTEMQELLLENSLIANNAEQDCDILGARISWSGVNFDSDQSCVRWSSSDRTDVDIPLGRLADNGGVTHTHALLFGNPAIDAATGDCLDTDQRGVARPQGSACDVGAYEFELVTEDIDLEITGTPIPPTTTNRDTLCWEGPGSNYGVVGSLPEGTALELIGIGAVPAWYIARHPDYPNIRCWIPEGHLNLPGTNPDLPTISIPGTPTPTITPTVEGPCYDEQDVEIPCH